MESTTMTRSIPASISQARATRGLTVRRLVDGHVGFSPRLFALGLGMALLGGATASAHADAIGVRAGAYWWNPDFDGTVKSGGEKVDINSDLGFSDDSANVFFVAIEHPLPVLPNVLLQRTQLDSQATNALSRTFTFDGNTYTAADTVKTDIDLSHTDATLYYELLDNWLELDLGLTIRHFDNGVKIRAINAAKESKVDINATIPMLYASARFNLPLTGVYVAVDGNGVGYSGNTLIDYRAMVGYESPIGLGAEVGVRNFDLKYEDGNDRADVRLDGVYAEVFYHF
jgi:outer membrane protein